MTATDIVDSIDSHLVALEREISSLQAARDALATEPTAADAAPQEPTHPARRTRAQRSTTPDGSHSPRRKARARRAARSAPAVLSADALFALLSGSEPLTTTALAHQTDGDRDQVLALLRELEKAGRVRRLGERRATRWRAFTEEDWVEERTAQLAAQSRSAR
jgi:hypothetical protein